MATNPLKLHIVQLIRFGLVGIIGFVVDTTALYLGVIFFQINPYEGRLLSYCIAATTTWMLNRNFTFSGNHVDSAHYQWAKFVLANSIGGATNYGVYSILIASSPFFLEYLILAVAIGSLSGLILNFFLSKKFVFMHVTE